MGKYSDSKSNPNRGCKICIFVSLIFLLITAALIVTLFFTIFKAKDPKVSLHPVDLQDLDFFEPNKTTVPLVMIITIVNPNYGTFISQNATGYINYGDMLVAEVPLKKTSIPARATTNITTTVGLMSGKLLANTNFMSDIGDGSFNLTSNATLPGKIQMLKIFKLKAVVHISCGIYFDVNAMETDSSCIAKIKI